MSPATQRRYTRAELTTAFWGVEVINGQPGDYPLGRLLYYLDEAEPGLRWSLDAPYQRGAVWTTKQQEAFLGAFVAGGMVPPGPPIILNIPGLCGVGTWSDPTWVVDGKQRLTALAAFLRGEVKADIGGSLGRVGVDQVDRNGYLIRTVAVDFSLRDQIRFYLRLNAGVPHSAADIEHARALLVAAR